MKIICADTLSVGHSHDANFREKIPKHRNYTNDATLRSGFFRETRSVTVPRFGFFFQDSRIRVKSDG